MYGQDSTKPPTQSSSMDPTLQLALEIGVPIVFTMISSLASWLLYKKFYKPEQPSTPNDSPKSKAKIKNKNLTGDHNQNIAGNQNQTGNTTTTNLITNNINNYHGTAPAGSSDLEGATPLLTNKK